MSPPLTDKDWRSLPAPPAGFSNVLGLSPFQAHLLYNRGIRLPSEIEPYLAADDRLLNDPALLPDMGLAVARLRKALGSGEKIGIFGDFDADGVTGTALLVRALGDLGGTTVPYLPHRVEEGHGLNTQALQQLSEAGVSVVVTVDCGTSSVDEVRLAASLGVDVIVTDHHTMLPGTPQLCALINPKRPDSVYPYPHLTGAGMSFKLAQALYEELGRPRPDHLAELAALGTVADVGPLVGENRYLVKSGLAYLNSAPSPGVQALMASAGLKPGTLDAGSLAFGLIPRLNVAGRLDHASISLDLLTAPSREAAEPLAEELDRRNRERQSLTGQGFDEAQRQVADRIKSQGIPSAIVVASEAWVPGILGLIAARLVDTYHRPAAAILLGKETSRASARSIPEFDIVDALTQCEDHLLQFGGHPQAAGFTVLTSSLPILESRLQGLAEERLRDQELRPSIQYDCEVSPRLLEGDNFAFIQSLSPFGAGNPAPVFLTRNARVVDKRTVGAQGQHLKMRLAHSGATWDAIAFRQAEKVERMGEKIDLLFTPELNHWGGGKPRLQLVVRDLRPGR